MRFPLRLTADLTKARIAQALSRRLPRSPVLRLSPVVETSSSGSDSAKHSLQTKTEAELLALVQGCAAPVIWIAGVEPLRHPQIGHITRRIVDCGRHVFVQTDGTLLRRGIFAFRPVSRLFLTVQLNGLENSHDLRACRAGVFRAAIEGIRAAKLSGFLVCVQTLIDGQTKLEELPQLNSYLAALGVDGRVISTGYGSGDAPETRKKVQEARKLIGNRGWESFSRLIDLPADDERSWSAAAEKAGHFVVAEDKARMPQRVKSETQACSEGARIP